MTAMRNMNCRQGGFTLVEMMVAMLLGIMILLAVSEVFVNNNRTRIEIENTTRQIENGRYAMQLLESELANAGFWGEASTVDFPAALPPACASSPAEVENSLGLPVYGGDNLSSGSDCRGADVKAGNDYLAVRRSSTCAVGPGCGSFLADAYHLRVSACESSNPGVITIAKTEANLAIVTDRSCANPAPTYRYLNRLYYVRSDDVLVRSELVAGGGYEIVPLVDGIERLHFAYGLDDNGDGGVDRFLDAARVDSGVAGASWEDVVAIRIWLLARNIDRTAGYTDSRTYVLGGKEPPDEYTPDDGFKRQLYTSTVRLNNVAGRRESPVVAGAAAGEEEPPAEDPSTETPSDPVI